MRPHCSDYDNNITTNEALQQTDLATIRRLFRPDIPEEHLVYQAISTSRQHTQHAQTSTTKHGYDIPSTKLR